MNTLQNLKKYLASPCCQAELNLQENSLVCSSCSRCYPVLSGVPSLMPDSVPQPPERNKYDVSVLVLTRNEAGNIGPQLDSAAKVLRDLEVSYELVVIDGHSTDDTAEEALSQGAKVEKQTEPGYGNAFRQGLNLCQGEWILTLDADGSHDPNFIRSVWTQRNTAELIIASRYAQGDAQMPWSRLMLSKILNVWMGSVLSIPVCDLSSGYRLYRRSALENIRLEGRDFNVLIELLTKMYLEGFLVREVPFFYKPRGEGRSKASLLRFARSYLQSTWSLWRLRNSISAADYDSRAYYSLIYPQRYWQQQRFKIIIGMLDGQKDEVLDVGCGSSKIVKSLPGMVGLDANFSKLRYLRKHHTRLVHGSIFALPFPNETFETVICSQVIEHIPDTEQAVSELLRVLKPGGRLILGTPDYSGWQWPLIERIYEKVIPGGYADEHITHLTRDGMVEMVERLGTSYLREEFILKAEWVGLFRKHP